MSAQQILLEELRPIYGERRVWLVFYHDREGDGKWATWSGANGQRMTLSEAEQLANSFCRRKAPGYVHIHLDVTAYPDGGAGCIFREDE